MKRFLAFLMAALMLLTPLAGCKGSEKENKSDVADASSKTQAVTIGYTLYEPMNYNDEDGTLIGFDTELATKVFTNLGYTPVFKLIDWNNKYVELNSGTINCIWNGFTANTNDDDGVARSEKVDFSYNYMKNKQVVVVKEGTQIATAADLKGKKGAAEKGSAGESYAKEFDGVTIKGVTAQTDALMEVNSATSDFAVLDEQLAKSMCGKGNYTSLKIIESLSSDTEFYAIGFKKGSDLTSKVNAELEKLAQDGTITTLAKKYGVENTAVIDFSDQK